MTISAALPHFSQPPMGVIHALAQPAARRARPSAQKSSAIRHQSFDCPREGATPASLILPGMV